MNKIYKVVWNNARKCYVVVSEIAKNRGKNNVRSIVERLASRMPRLAARIQAATLWNAAGMKQVFAADGQLPAHPRTAARWAAPVLAAGILLQTASGFASTIKNADGNNLAGNGKVHNLYVQDMLDNNKTGVNKFNEYKISAGDIANMHFNKKDETVYVTNLVNLVHSKIDINGTVNAVRNGKIDGNLYFISPNGMTVGKTGVINAGRLGAFIPAASYWDELWNYKENVVNNFADFENYGKRDGNGNYSVISLQVADGNGNYKDTRLEFAKGKKIEIEGRINTRNGIVLGARDIQVKEGAVLRRSASAEVVNFNELVNIKDSAGKVTLNAGLGADLNAAVDGSTGDIILRAESSHSFVNGIVSSELYESIMKTEVKANVEMAGSIVTDGPADLSAEASTSFINTAYGGTSIFSDIAFNFLDGIGITRA